MAEFFAMDGYAVWVWTSYALTFAGVGALVWRAITARRAAKQRLERLQEDRA